MRLIISEARGPAKRKVVGDKPTAKRVPKKTQAKKATKAKKPEVKTRKREAKTDRKGRTWWQRMSVARQRAYLKAHPNSAYSDQIKEDIKEARKLGLKPHEKLADAKAQGRKPKPERPDPYADREDISTDDMSADYDDPSHENEDESAENDRKAQEDQSYDDDVSEETRQRHREEDVEDLEDKLPDPDEFDVEEKDMEEHGSQISSFKGYVADRVAQKSRASRSTVKHGLSFFRKAWNGEPPTDKEYEHAKDLMKLAAIGTAAVVGTAVFGPVATLYMGSKFVEVMKDIDPSDDSDDWRRRRDQERLERMREERDSKRERREMEDMIDAFGQFVANSSPEDLKRWAKKDRRSREQAVKNNMQRS